MAKSDAPGVFIPFEVLTDQRLTPTEKICCAMVDALVKSRGHGCWATNKWLASQMGTSSQQVKRSISKLAKLGLVVVLNPGLHGEKRLLETKWSRVVVPQIINDRGDGSYMIPHNSPSGNLDKLNINSGETEMRGFDGREVSTSKRNVPKTKRLSPFHKMCANQLRSSVNAKKGIRLPSNVTQDGHAFRLLMERDGIDHERVEAALDWHCSHLNDKYEPKAYTGDDFRSKFLKIEAALHRAHPPRPDIEISPKVMDAVQRLKMNGWKKGSVDQLPIEVQLSTDFVAKLRASLCELRDESAGYLKMYVEAILQRIPSMWVERYYERLHKRLHGWDAWSGDLEPFRLHADSKEVTTMIETIAREYGGDQSGAKYAAMILAHVRESE